jgi:hypothetical protein
MRSPTRLFLSIGLLVSLWFTTPAAQNQPQPPGRPIGTITTRGELIVLELDAGAIAAPNLFDLSHRTLKFTPAGSGYRVENLPARWDAAFGDQLSGSQVTLKNFSFPFSGRKWDAFSVGQTGTISFGAPESSGGRGSGPPVGRFAELRTAAGTLINTLPSIAVFLKPRMSGQRYVKQLADRVLITWTLSEPAGGVFDFTWVPTVNRFQAALGGDGSIELSYDQVAAQDAIVGVYPMVTAGVDRQLAALDDAEDAEIPPHLDLKTVRLASVDDLFLRVTLETRGAVLPEGDPQLSGVSYRVSIDPDKPYSKAIDETAGEVVWTIRGSTQGRGGSGPARYVVSGPGASPIVKIEKNTISVMGTLPKKFRKGSEIGIAADAKAAGAAAPADSMVARGVKPAALQSPEVDLSAATRFVSDGTDARLGSPGLLRPEKPRRRGQGRRRTSHLQGRQEAGHDS